MVDGADPRYATLGAMFRAAYEQAASGKGDQRHGSEKPFEQQRIMTLSRDIGPGGLAFQISKKAAESVGMADRNDPMAAYREALGIMVYGAALALLYAETANHLDWGTP